MLQQPSVVVKFAHGKAGVYPRDKARVFFGLVDSLLVDFDEPQTIEIPQVSLESFQKIYIACDELVSTLESVDPHSTRKIAAFLQCPVYEIMDAHTVSAGLVEFAPKFLQFCTATRNDFVKHALSAGNVELIERFHGMGHVYTPAELVTAVNSGDIASVEYLLSIGVEYKPPKLSIFDVHEISRPTPAIVKLLAARGYRGHELYLAAVRAGDRETFRLLARDGVSNNIVRFIARAGKTEFLTSDLKYNVDADAMSMLVLRGDVEAIRAQLPRFSGLWGEVTMEAGTRIDREFLRFLAEIGLAPRGTLVEAAIKQDAAHVFEFHAPTQDDLVMTAKYGAIVCARAIIGRVPMDRNVCGRVAKYGICGGQKACRPADELRDDAATVTRGSGRRETAEFIISHLVRPSANVEILALSTLDQLRRARNAKKLAADSTVSSDLFCLALKLDRLDVIKFLCEDVGYHGRDVAVAVGSTETLNYLLDRGMLPRFCQQKYEMQRRMIERGVEV